MSIERTIGGDRVGSGKKMKTYLHNYNRSTHNLSQRWASSMGSGILYPALCIPAMRGDSFDIDLLADCRTIPTTGPLFGSYKMQIDVYQCPVRLYQGILHNNPQAIGLKMSQVKFPKIYTTTEWEIDNWESGKFSTSCLLKYLGMSGIGRSSNNNRVNGFGRKINAIPALAYYDIYKTYYANKQEEKGYVISPKDEIMHYGTSHAYYNDIAMPEDPQMWKKENQLIETDKTEIVKIKCTNLYYLFLLKQEENIFYIEIVNSADGTSTIGELSGSSENNPITLAQDVNYYAKFDLENQEINIYIKNAGQDINVNIEVYKVRDTRTYKKELGLNEFNLSNIDDMRYDLLSHNQLGNTYLIQDNEDIYLPYSTLVKKIDNKTMNKYPMNGLCLKTYQNDIFNNWLNTEWIEGENGINEMSKVAIVDGAFSMDSLNFATKLYNMLNRIAVAGNTYEDWQDVVYEEVARRQIESPIFIGGMSQEVVFDEIVQTAPGEYDGEQTSLGTLGGRGRVLGESKKGGKMHVKCDEACFIIAIVSLTPRIYYTQGNEFYMTEIDSLDDMHKPPMDGIGFQDLIGERLAWWDTVITGNSATVQHRNKIGKLPAWIEYMTAVDKAYGDFADDNASFMILNRHYEMDEETHGIKDATTYIDPEKYNYAFAYNALEAQNFWVQIDFKITARRLMSARLIPNV